MSPEDVTHTWERLVRFHRQATTAMDANLRAQFDRGLDDYDVLHQVRAHQGPIRMGELAQRLLIANSSCHRIVGRLVDEGLLERLPGTSDKREVLIQLSSEGRRQWRRMAAVHTRDIETLVGTRLSPTQSEQLDAITRRLLDDEQNP